MIANTPQATVKAFYSWYVACSKAMDASPPACDYLGKNLAAQRAHLTPRFYGDLVEVNRLQQQIRGEVIGVDPFSGTQMGTCSFSLGKTSVSGRTATVWVTLNLCPLHGTHTVKVALAQIAGAWRIADVVTAEGGSQDAVIESSIKDARKQLHAHTPHPA